MEKETQNTQEGGEWVEEMREMEKEDRREALMAKIRAEAERVAGLGNIGERQAWGDAGLDSLGTSSLRSGLQRQLGDALALSSTALYDYPCVGDLVDYIESALFPKASGQEIVFRAVRVEPLAIVGMACRFPAGLDSPGGLWEFLEARGDGVSEIPLTRMDWRHWYNADGLTAGKAYTNRGAFLKGATLFDHGRFGISAAEAAAMDPHQRIALETAYTALTQAGMLEEASVGVFAAVMTGMQGATVTTTFTPLSGAKLESVGEFTAAGAGNAICSNRISHALGLNGPSMTIDTAGSSSLVALDTASKAIINADCDVAVVVGVNLLVSMAGYVTKCGAKMLSKRGRCAAFSAEADGYCPGEGCGALVLKPLSVAQHNGDAIWGVVHGSAVNHGHSATLTMSNGPAQEEVIRKAIGRAGIVADDVGYVEAHGTGTPLGDAQEAGALAHVFGGRCSPLVVGAVKSNLGHLEGAAGMAGMIKAVLCLQRRQVPPNIHCTDLNSDVEALLGDCWMEFPVETVELEGEFAGVSSFGYGGTNAHVVLGGAPEGSETPSEPVIAWERSPFSWQDSPHPFVGRCETQGIAMVWTSEWDESIVHYLAEHRVGDMSMVSAAVFMEMVAPAVEEVFGDVGYEVRELQLEMALCIGAGRLPRVRVTIEPGDTGGEDDGVWNVAIESAGQAGDEERVHARMKLQVGKAWEERVEMQEIMGRCIEGTESGEEFYATVGNAYGGDFRSLTMVWAGEGEWLGRIEMGDGVDGTGAEAPAFLRSCAWLDAATQVGLASLDPGGRLAGMYVAEVAALRMTTTKREDHRVVWSHLEQDPEEGCANVSVFDDSGRILARIVGMRAGVFNPHKHSVVSVDMWVACNPQPERFDGDVEILRPESVEELHSMVLARMESQAPLCVVGNDGGFAGYVRCVVAEYPQWKVMCLEGNEEPDAGIPALWEEVECLRKDGSWCVKRLSWLPEPRSDAPEDPVVTSEGTYVISGGLGFLGRLVAEALIEEGATKLVLLSSSRSELPEDWELEVRPTVERCDVGDLEEVRRVIGKHGDIRGIVHAAGVMTDGEIWELTEEEFRMVHRPKVDGARHLHECSEGLELDFFVLFSSIVSGLGSLGQANNAAANGRLDALAVERQKVGLPALSVRWGPWLGGEAVSEAMMDRMENDGMLALEPSQGLEILLQLILHRQGPVVMVCPMDPQKLPRTPYFSRVRVERWEEEGREAGGNWVEEMREMEKEDRREALMAKIRAEAERVAGLGNIGERQAWGDAGLDSLGLMELHNGLQRQLGDALALSSTALYDYPCVGDFVHYIESTLFPKASGQEIVFRAARVEPLAIVGMACRFPGGLESPGGLWEFLEAGGDCVSEIPLTRMDWRHWYNADGLTAGKAYTNRGAFLKGATLFDHGRFGISAAEAAAMDPHQRIALETAYTALTQAGMLEEASVGVFTAVMTGIGFTQGLQPGSGGEFTAAGAGNAICSNRISHALGLNGPSMTIDTAGSSSLVALDTASKAIINADCDVAVVVGVNLLVSMAGYVTKCGAKMLSKRGRCAAFSAEADGYCPGEGCGALVLKPLSVAQHNGDAIWGVVHGSAVNHGHSATLMMSNGPAQEEVIRKAIGRAGIVADDVGYVEAHGTGSPLGDAQEAGALAHVFGGRCSPLVVGAVKSNLGHLEGAAGMAGMIKAVLCLQRRQVPPNIHCTDLSSDVEALLGDCWMEFPMEMVELEGEFAGVSSFGYGGTNAHVVLGGAPEGSETPSEPVIAWERSEFSLDVFSSGFDCAADRSGQSSPQVSSGDGLQSMSEAERLEVLRGKLQEALAGSMSLPELVASVQDALNK